MRVRIEPGNSVGGSAAVPGDKSIAHRWLILAATADGPSELRDLPPALDVRSTARCLASLSGRARGALEAWTTAPGLARDGDGFTRDNGEPRPAEPSVILEARGRSSLEAPGQALDCGNSGTTMRLLAGLLSSCPFRTVLTGDASLSTRPMERVAEPLRRMGAAVRTDAGHPPMEIQGGALRGLDHELALPSAQVKGALLLAGLSAEGETRVLEPSPTRDHTERALAHLGAPVVARNGVVSVRAFQHPGFAASVPGDVSSAAFLLAAAALTGRELTVTGVGLNPTRTHFLSVMERMGIPISRRVMTDELGEPLGEVHVSPCEGLRGTTVEASELPLVIDEVPILAVLAAAAVGGSRFVAAGELRIKESDRLGGLAEEIRSLGGGAVVEGDDLLVEGGGLRGGLANARDDHRLAMALVVGALGAGSPVEVEGIEAADVSFPGFAESLRSLGARLEG